MKKYLSVAELVVLTRMKKPLMFIGAMISVNLIANLLLFVVNEQQGNPYSIYKVVPVFSVTLLAAYVSIIFHGLRTARSRSQAGLMLERLSVSEEAMSGMEFLAGLLLFIMLFEAEIVSIYLADGMNQLMTHRLLTEQDLVIASYKAPLIRCVIPIGDLTIWKENVWMVICGGLVYGCIGMSQNEKTAARIIGAVPLILIPFVFVVREENLFPNILHHTFFYVIVNFSLAVLLITLILFLSRRKREKSREKEEKEQGESI